MDYKTFTVFYNAQTECGRKFKSSTVVRALSKELAAQFVQGSYQHCVAVTSVMCGR